MSLSNLRLTLCLVGVLTLLSYQTTQTETLPVSQTQSSTQTEKGVELLKQLPFDVPDNLTEDPLTVADQAKIAGITTSFGKVSEWLGPLAPIAISPFFGITILAGLSQFGEGLPFNSFISDNPILGNPAVFWIFLALTIITSLPRLTKVSKPAAQAIDQLEAYAGIITIVLIRLITMIPEAEPSSQTAMVVQMGFLSFSADVLLSIAAIINIIVINTVKFFFEMMVWLIPFPFVDAMLEAANKSLCAGLMAVYAWSPTAATILNLLIFVACLFMFRWIYRRVAYFRALVFDPIWGTINKGYGVPTRKELVVFSKSEIGPFPARAKLRLCPDEDGWVLIQDRWFVGQSSHKLPRDEVSLVIKKGVMSNTIEVDGSHGANRLVFSRRYSDNLEKLSELIGVEIGDAVEVVDSKLEFS